jgi:hypothetical protein
MKVIPIMKCKDMKESLFFYTNVLDFEIEYPDSRADDPVELTMLMNYLRNM